MLAGPHHVDPSGRYPCYFCSCLVIGREVLKTVRWIKYVSCFVHSDVGCFAVVEVAVIASKRRKVSDITDLDVIAGAVQRTVNTVTYV